MSISTPAELDELINKATSASIPNGELDLPVALEVSDVIRSRKIPPKESMRCLKRRIGATVTNPNTQLSSWKLVDICIKNCGMQFITEICSKEFMDMLEHTILKQKNESYDKEILDLSTTIVYELYVTFKNDSQLGYVKKVYERLINKGVTFPEGIVANVESQMTIFDSKTPADWVESDACMICSKKFSFLNRRHHCRSCGGIYCQDHSSHFITLPDLGIYDSVRVCDNCFDEYDSKKTPKSDKKKHKKHKKKLQDSQGEEQGDEDVELKRAIELSLKESRGYSVEPIVPVVEPPKTREGNDISEEEMDADLKAAIEASLKEAENEKLRKEQQQQQQQLRQAEQTQPSFDLSTADEEDIYLFASLVERMKTQPIAEVLENRQLQMLYEKVMKTKPRLNVALNDKITKYNTLIEMNGEISDVMNMYDDLLEEQLKSINISQQYAIPSQMAPPQPYPAYQVAEDFPQYHAPPSTVPQQDVSHEQQQFQQRRALAEHLSSERREPAQAQRSKFTELSGVSNNPEAPYPADSPQLSNEPSEPVYPDSDAIETTTNGTGEQNNVSTGYVPYPPESTYHKEQTSTEPTQALKENITSFDFPTVPVKKVAPNHLNNEHATTGTESLVVEEPPKEEELLIEL